MELTYKGKKLYYEDIELSSAFRHDYLASINNLIEKKRKASHSARYLHMTPEMLKSNPEEYREKYINMLGWPLSEYKPELPVPEVEETFVATDEQSEIYRLKIKVMDNFNFYGLLFLPLDLNTDSVANGKRPLVIAQHGGGGTPELCSDMHGPNNYNHMVRKHIERGSVVFAPQLLLWNCNAAKERNPYYGDKYERAEIDRSLNQLGGSITALEVFCIMRSVDYLVTRPEVDSCRIGMNGISYGGFYSLMVSAADKRIVSTYSCAFFNNRYKYNWSDFIWPNSGNLFLDAEVAALIAPRNLYIEVGKEDRVFTYDTAVKEFQRVPQYYEAFGASGNLCFNVWDGGHTLDATEKGMDFFYSAFETS